MVPAKANIEGVEISRKVSMRTEEYNSLRTIGSLTGIEVFIVPNQHANSLMGRLARALQAMWKFSIDPDEDGPDAKNIGDWSVSIDYDDQFVIVNMRYDRLRELVLDSELPAELANYSDTEATLIADKERVRFRAVR